MFILIKFTITGGDKNYRQNAVESEQSSKTL